MKGEPLNNAKNLNAVLSLFVFKNCAHQVVIHAATHWHEVNNYTN